MNIEMPRRKLWEERRLPSEKLVEFQNITKIFGGTKALERCVA